MKKKKVVVFICILLMILVGFFIFVYFNKKDRNMDPSFMEPEVKEENPSTEKKENKTEEEKNQIDIPDKEENPKQEDSEKLDSDKNTTVEESKKPNSDKNTTAEDSKKPVVKPEEPTIPPVEEKPIVETQEQKNDKRRKELENIYSIKILYGKEIGNYKPRMLTPTPMTDSSQIAEYLEKINNTLKYYPKGFFKDFLKIDMPLTIILIDSVQNDGFAGLTDKEFYDDIRITITTKGVFNYVLNHEIMHYIDTYLTIKQNEQYIKNDWIKLNPVGYQYGSFISDYNYNMSNHKNGAYFIENYAQTNISEDRAKTFEYMMSRAYAPAGCFEEGETIRKKAELIAKQIKNNFPSASNATTRHWERFIK